MKNWTGTMVPKRECDTDSPGTATIEAGNHLMWKELCKPKTAMS